MASKASTGASLIQRENNNPAYMSVANLLDLALVTSLQLSEIDIAEQYLGTRSGLVCGIHPAEEPDQVPPVEQPDEDDDDKEKQSVRFRLTA